MSTEIPLSDPLKRINPHLLHRGFRRPDPFARERSGASFVNALLATTLFRCWHILLLFAGWSSLITVLNHQGHALYIQPTLLTVIGTVLGFVISYRTTSSFERYNEGRQLWSQVILASRTFARTTWFHVPDQAVTESHDAYHQAAQSLVEKKSVINLLEAFSVSLKHYLRGEDGIYYQDLYYLVKFLPAYALPAGMPPVGDHPQIEEHHSLGNNHLNDHSNQSTLGKTQSLHQRVQSDSPSKPEGLPLPVTSLPAPPKGNFFRSGGNPLQHVDKTVLPRSEEEFLFPASILPEFHISDLFPFSLAVRYLTTTGKGEGLKGKKAAKFRAKMLKKTVSYNLPLEISLYLSSYIAALQKRQQGDGPTHSTLLCALDELVDSLTGLERILTTPIPFSYSVHLWLVTTIYCFTLPPQIWPTLGWITIPATIIASFIFFGFLAAGEEIENPFGYDKNDLNLDHFTSNIIRNELRAITSSSPPDPARWAFVPENNLLFTTIVEGERTTPDMWMKKGPIQMQEAMSA